jgi:hypothetical protein
MKTPLEFPKKDDGQLLDGRSLPIVVVFDSKSRPGRGRHITLNKPRKTTSRPEFVFINVSYPGQSDEDSRRLVKTHVMRNVLQRAEEQEATNKENTTCAVFTRQNEKPQNIYDHTAPWANLTSPPVALSNIIYFPVEMQPYMPDLLHNCT